MNETLFILSSDDNEQLILALHETCEVKQRARLYLNGCLVSETRPDNIAPWGTNTSENFHVLHLLLLKLIVIENGV